MANVKKEDRVQDTDIKRLNHLGLGLKAIAKILGCHPATITNRLTEMGIKPTDTRRSFMEKVFNSLSQDEQDWLSHNLFNRGIDVQDFVVSLISDAYKVNPNIVAPTPAPLPEMDGGSKMKGAKADKIWIDELPTTPDVEEQPLGGQVYSPDTGPSPDQTVEPERVETQPLATPEGIPPKPQKLKFGT